MADNQAAVPGDAELRDYVVSHIGEAVEKGWVLPFYQPVVRTLTGKLCGFEALARWDDPVYGLLPPAAFISALEGAGLIHLLDCSIVKQVCMQYRECVNRGEPTVPVSFNLSRLDFDLCDIFSEVESAVHEYGVPRRMLNIEITETAFGSDPVVMNGLMRRFHDAGYQVWMDDFGSGYSSLNVLKDFEFDELKIDMAFLSRFDERSETILASVVDMAKKLGIQTLAEGVETEEHRAFLRRIGCEKMQGYLFGRPQRCYSEELLELRRRIGVETIAEEIYVSEVGSVNTLSLSERDLTAGNSTRGYVTSMSLATIEHSGGRFRVLESNRVFRESLENLGISSLEDAERRINARHGSFARHAQRLAETIERDEFAQLDYMAGDIACVIRAKHITTRDGKTAMLVSVDDVIQQGERRRHDRMDAMLATMYTIYEHVDVIHLDEGYIEPVFGNIGLHSQFDAKAFDEVTDVFAEAEVYARDRARYKRFMDHATMVERIRRSGENYLADFFRLRQGNGEYAWKAAALILVPDQPGNQVMLCIRSTHWAHDGLLQAAYDESFDENPHALKDADFTMIDGSLWRSLRDGRVAMFWKDSERRFVGVNQAFLDYYGFESDDEVLGKTDEDMGWHIDPAAFMEHEQRVLEEGTPVVNAAGQCIVRGEVHGIVANKRPVYRNGRIIGLVGYFVDVADGSRFGSQDDALPTHDAVTGVLNYIGLEAATWQYVDAFRRKGTDFSMASINVENLAAINAALGDDFGDKVLRRVGEELSSVAGSRRVVGHVYADRFVILVQGGTDDELQAFCDKVEQRISGIAKVDGTPCTVYALAGFARFSRHGDIEAMKRYNRDRRIERRDAWSGGASDNDDVITSSLL